MTAPTIRLAYSVDADDAFMFHAIAHGAVDLRGLRFEHQRADTATLNQIAVRGEADVVAVSLGAYPSFADRYLLLPHGASVGRGFGPVLVAREPISAGDLRGRRVGIPGLDTTAYLVLRLIVPDLQPVVVPIAPFSRAFDELDAGRIDAALLIHEGRLLFQQRGLHPVVELGQWWQQQTSLPLPLGVNVVRRDLGDERLMLVSQVLREAIAWALAPENRAAVIENIAAQGQQRGDAALADTAMLDRYLGMYANEDTRAMAPDVRAAIDELFRRAIERGLLPGGFEVRWSP